MTVADTLIIAGMPARVPMKNIGLAALVLVVGLLLQSALSGPAVAQDTAQSPLQASDVAAPLTQDTLDLLSVDVGDDNSEPLPSDLYSGPTGYSIEEAQAARAALGAPTNIGIISQAGNNNFASNITIGIGNVVVQDQRGDNNFSEVNSINTVGTTSYTLQDGNDLNSSVSVLGATGTSVNHLQQGDGENGRLIVLGNAAIIANDTIILNRTGRPIVGVTLIDGAQ